MKSRTLVLFSLLLLVVVGALAWFQTHQHHLNTQIRRGGMSADVRQSFLDKGVDCQEAYELQGYEATESLFKTFGLSQHEFYSLNPGMSMDFKPGQVICIRGVWGITAGSDKGITWFWPAVAVVAAAAGFLASKALSTVQAARKQTGSLQADAGSTV